MERRMKVIYRSCICGNLNEVRIAKSIHNRQTFCGICDEFSWKEASSLWLFTGDFDVFKYSVGSFAQFAIAWG